MQRIKVGVIGTGFIGPVHIEGLQRNSGLVEVVAVAGSSVEKAREVADKFGVLKAFGNYKDMLADENIQAVHICSPNHLHYIMVKEAIEAGKHVVCEKPLALTHKEGEELLRLAEASDVYSGIHFNLRYYPLIQNLRYKIAAGELGKLSAVHGGFLQDWLLYDTDYNWRLESDLAGESRVVGDLGSHWLDTMEFLTGERIIKLCADFSRLHDTRKKPMGQVQTFASSELTEWSKYKVDTEDQATLIFRMSGGITGTALFSQTAAGRKCSMNFEINGSKGSAAWDSEKPNQMWHGFREGYNSMQIKDPASFESGAKNFLSYPGGHQEGFGDTVKQYCREFYTAVIENREPNVPQISDGLREILLCDAILKSVKEEKWIEPELNI
jgi:predicted dehydrogenase